MHHFGSHLVELTFSSGLAFDMKEITPTKKKRFISMDCLDISVTTCYDLLIIISSFVNIVIDIILFNHLYSNKQLSFAAILLSLHIFSHICYVIAFTQLYEYKVSASKTCAMCSIQYVLFVVLLLILSPMVNLLIYLTSAEDLILTKKFDKIFKSKWMHENVKYPDNDTWHQAQVTRLFGYVFVEFFTTNVSQFIFKLIIINDAIQSSNFGVWDSTMLFYLFFSFYLNLFCIVIKSYCLAWCFLDVDEILLNQIFLAWSSVMADFSTFICLFVWMYVQRILI